MVVKILEQGHGMIVHAERQVSNDRSDYARLALQNQSLQSALDVLIQKIAERLIKLVYSRHNKQSYLKDFAEAPWYERV